MPFFMAEQSDPGKRCLEQNESQEGDEPVRNASYWAIQVASADAEYLDIDIRIHLGEAGNILAVQQPVDYGLLTQRGPACG